VGAVLSYYVQTLRDFYSLQRNLHLKRSELVELQNKRLRSVVRHAYESVPFYRRTIDAAGVQPEQIKTVQDLSKLPCVTKKEIKQNVKDVVSANFDLGSLRTLSTSGSTGQPLQVFVSRQEDGFRKAKHLRANYNCGHKPFQKWLTVTSPSHFSEVSGVQKRIKFYSPKFVSVFWDVQKQLSVISDFNPTVLDGYSSSLALLAREVQKFDGFDIRPKIVFGGAELVDDLSRKIIEESFNAPFYDQYATIEFERMAWQCPKREGYHIDADSVVLEFLDSKGERVSPGESGKIVCTSLFNYAMPFIRYVVGDWGIYSDEKCSCGRSLPLMSRIEGRSDSLLFLPGGRILSPRAITISMSGFRLNSFIEQYKMVQRRKDFLEIQLKMQDSVEARRSVDDGIMERDIVAHFQSALGIEKDAVSFEIAFVDDIPIGKNGKLQIIESDLKKEP
jgi:phenylacetate-CoA ligase